MKKIKKLLLISCVLTCLFALTSCSDSKKEKITYQYSESDLLTSISQDIEQIQTRDDEKIDEDIESCIGYDSAKVLKTALESWKRTKKESGNIVEIYKDDAGAMKYTLKTKDNCIYIRILLKCEKRDVAVNYTYGIVDDSVGVTELTFEAQYTLKEKLTKAGLNTLLGIATVVFALAFLCIIISLFKYINIMQKIFEQKKLAKKEGLDNTVLQIVEKEEVNVEDDTEIVAVITAAIAASQQTSADGFVVRSIRKVPNSKWKKS